MVDDAGFPVRGDMRLPKSDLTVGVPESPAQEKNIAAWYAAEVNDASHYSESGPCREGP